LGWRRRALYDTRPTFITLTCDEDGANRDIIRDRVTHTKVKRSAFDGYARGQRWDETYREVAWLRVSRRPHVTGRVTVGDFSTTIEAPHAARSRALSLDARFPKILKTLKVPRAPRLPNPRRRRISEDA